MKNDILTAIAVPLLACVFFVLGASLGMSYAKSQAVKAGVGVWVADENGKPVFKWKEVQP